MLRVSTKEDQGLRIDRIELTSSVFTYRSRNHVNSVKVKIYKFPASNREDRKLRLDRQYPKGNLPRKKLFRRQTTCSLNGIYATWRKTIVAIVLSHHAKGQS
jgi:hypothetical protein